jgi:hypothetical protein
MILLVALLWGLAALLVVGYRMIARERDGVSQAARSCWWRPGTVALLLGSLSFDVGLSGTAAGTARLGAQRRGGSGPPRVRRDLALSPGPVER